MVTSYNETDGTYGFSGSEPPENKKKTWLLVLVPILLAALLIGVPVALYFGLSDGSSDDEVAVVDTTVAPTTVAPSTTSTTEFTSKSSLGDSVAVPTTTAGEAALPVSGDPVDDIRVFVGERFAESDLPVMVNAFVPGLLAVRVPDSSSFSYLNVGAEAGLGSTDGELNLIVYTQFATDLSTDRVVEFYSVLADELRLVSGETEQGSDGNGDFTVADYGDFVSHPSPEIEWANLRVVIREGAVGSNVELFYNQRTVGDLPLGGAMGAVVSDVPLADGYEIEKYSFTVSRFNSNSKEIDLNLSVQAVTPAVVTDEEAEVGRYVEVYEATGVWEEESTTGTQVRFETNQDDDLSAYASLGYIGDDSSYVYNTLYFSTRLGYPQ